MAGFVAQATGRHHAESALTVRPHGAEMTDRATVLRWLADYEAAWRAPGTGALAGLFTSDASYQQSPYAQPVTGLDAIGWMWEAERQGPDEAFSLAPARRAVAGPVAVVRAEVRYGEPSGQEYRDLWVIRLGEDGRCTWFGRNGPSGAGLAARRARRPGLTAAWSRPGRRQEWA